MSENDIKLIVYARTEPRLIADARKGFKLLQLPLNVRNYVRKPAMALNYTQSCVETNESFKTK